MDSTLKALIWDKQSLVRVLQNAEVAKELFHDIQLNEDGNQRPIDNMGFAKQRPLTTSTRQQRLQPSWSGDVGPTTPCLKEPPKRCKS